MVEEKAKPSREMTTAEAIAALALQLKPQGPLEQAGMSQEAIDRVMRIPEPRKYRNVPGKSDDTGATMTLNVVESRKFPNGRIIGLQDYRHPPGMFTPRSQGGQVPDGHPMLSTGPGAPPDETKVEKHQLHEEYLQWRYESFWKRDLLNLVSGRDNLGVELQQRHCRDVDGLKTPWLAGKVGHLREDQPED
jgi:hypothetical protein